MISIEARRFRVRGLVQGVGFRFFVIRAAHDLGVAGWVRNSEDGGVEGVAEGKPECLDAFEERLRRGPRMSRVEDVGSEKVELAGFRSFEIR